MASVIRETVVDADPDLVWDALRDWGAVHRRLVPGFLLDARVEGRDRVVTSFTGAVVRELFLGADAQRRRLAWAIADGSLGLTHYSAAAQVLPEGAGRSRFVWTADFLPDERAATIAGLIERGLETIRTTLERAARDR
jgi:polyketide cyclase/dehydrase/lipid transport protein